MFDHAWMKASLELELSAVDLHEPSIDTILAAGRQRSLRRRLGSAAAVVVLVVSAGMAVSSVGAPAGGPAVAHPTAPAEAYEVMARGEFDGHDWELRMRGTRGCLPASRPGGADVCDTRFALCIQGVVDGAASAWECDAATDPERGRHTVIPPGSTTFLAWRGLALEGRIGLTSRETAKVVLQFGDGRTATVETFPEVAHPGQDGDQRPPMNWYAFPYPPGETVRIESRFDAAGNPLAEPG
ncbi:hypothetical protein OG216_24335 [Streptomycetaceae bacterium NBC_01309]